MSLRRVITLKKTFETQAANGNLTDLKDQLKNEWSVIKPAIEKLDGIEILHTGRFGISIQARDDAALTSLEKALPQTWGVQAPVPKATLF